MKSTTWTITEPEKYMTLYLIPLVAAVWAFYFMLHWPKRITWVAVIYTAFVAVFVAGHYLRYY